MAVSDLGVVKPIDKGIHDSTKTYEILNIVIDNAKTYMANKDVPAGTAISDAQYWLDMSGNSLTEQQLDDITLTKPTTANKIVTEHEKSMINAEIQKNKTDIAALQSGNQAKIGASDYAQPTVGGTIKLRVSGGDCFITTNGNDA